MALQYYEWRLLIGPPYRPHWDDRHFDWSVLDHGALGYPNPPATDLTATLADGQTIAQIANALEIWPPEGGGFWVGPNGVGEGWEYCEYEEYNWLAYNLRDLHREPADERTHNGVHTIGAEIKFWYEVAAVDGGTLRIEEVMNAAWAAVTWKATISGAYMPRLAVRNNHLALIQIRNSPTDQWRNELVGWLSSPRFRDDYERNAIWSVEIHSAAAMADRHEIAGITAGEMDIAEHGQAGGSTPLAKAYKERDAGDYTAADPNFQHESTIDGESSTLWISEQYIGSGNWQASNSDPHWTYDAGWNIDTRFVVSGICLERPTGYNSVGYRWIELTTVRANDGTTSMQDCTIYTNSNQNYVFADIGEADVEEGQKVIICEDANLFAEENPVNAAQSVIEINSLNAVGNANFWDDLDPAGGALAFRQLHDNQEWMHGVSWGNSNGWVVGDTGKPDEPDGSNDQDYWYWKPGDKTGSQTDPKPAGPTPGQCLRYLFAGDPDDGNAVNYWATDTLSAVGYTVGEHQRDAGEPNAGKIFPVYLVVELPVLPLSLRDDMDNSQTDPIYIEDASGANTGGIDDAGTIQVADEQIAYTSRTAEYVTGITRGANGTTPAAHNAGDVIRFVEASGVATDAHPILSFAWQRAGGTIYPKSFSLYTTTDAAAATPESSLWENDWKLEANWVTHSDPTWSHNLSATERIRKAMIVFNEMTVNPARARLNEFDIILDGSKYVSGTFLTNDEDAGIVTATALANAGLPAGAIIDSTTQAQAFYSATASDGGWAVAADVADFSNLRITIGRDSKATIEDDTYWGDIALTPESTWTRLEASAVEQTASQGDPIRQVAIAWRNYDESASGVVYYPASPDVMGGQLEIGPVVYPNEATAQEAATKIFYTRRMPYVYIVECATEQPAIEAGEIVQVTWKLYGEPAPWNRLMMIESVSHEIIEEQSGSGFTWKTVITGLQVDRKTE